MLPLVNTELTACPCPISSRNDEEVEDNGELEVDEVKEPDPDGDPALDVFLLGSSFRYFSIS